MSLILLVSSLLIPSLLRLYLLVFFSPSLALCFFFCLLPETDTAQLCSPAPWRPWRGGAGSPDMSLPSGTSLEQQSHAPVEPATTEGAASRHSPGRALPGKAFASTDGLGQGTRNQPWGCFFFFFPEMWDISVFFKQRMEIVPGDAEPSQRGDFFLRISSFRS